jgi:hypothetical protein
MDLVQRTDLHPCFSWWVLWDWQARNTRTAVDVAAVIVLGHWMVEWLTDNVLKFEIDRDVGQCTGFGFTNESDARHFLQRFDDEASIIKQ